MALHSGLHSSQDTQQPTPTVLWSMLTMLARPSALGRASKEISQERAKLKTHKNRLALAQNHCQHPLSL